MPPSFPPKGVRQVTYTFHEFPCVDGAARTSGISLGPLCDCVLEPGFIPVFCPFSPLLSLVKTEMFSLLQVLRAFT